MKTIQSNLLLSSFWIIGVVSFGIRLFINFSQELLSGNGGYYPLQVRTVLERGELAFPDMPFLFYLDAGIVRFLTFFGATASNELILNVVKVVDSLSVPLLLIPLYQILNLSKRINFSYFILSIVGFAVLSFYTLNLTSSFQKNSLAITILIFSISWFFKFLESKNWKQLIVAIAFLTLTGLTHFGTFAFALLLGTFFLAFSFKKKAVIPIILLITAALLLIYQFDTVRFSRLLLSWKGLFSRLPNPGQLLLTGVYLGFAIVTTRGYIRFKNSFNIYDKAIILTCISLLIFIPFPIIDPQASGRMSAFLFIPIVLILFKFEPFISIKMKKIVSIGLGVITLGSIGFFIIMTPPVEVSIEALKDMDKMKPYITEPDRTVIVSKHNLEFWVAWALEVDVSQESKFNDTLINDYEDIFIINQIRDVELRVGPGRRNEEAKRNHFDEPLIPANSSLVYSSEYFKLFQYHKVLKK